MDGSDPRRLTNDKHVERAPMWTGPGSVLFQSDRNGQANLWEISVADGRSWPRTSGPTQEPDSVSSDGNLLTFRQVLDNSDLWFSDCTSGALQLTADASTDFAPSASANGRGLVFQRSRPSSSGPFVETSTWLMNAVRDGGLTDSRSGAYSRRRLCSSSVTRWAAGSHSYSRVSQALLGCRSGTSRQG